MQDPVTTAAQYILEADGLLITAGAGMGIDSGLPDFRGPEGFWRAYPALGKARMMFEEIACPDAFVQDAELAWGFYAHRLNLYRRTEPHGGFAVLREVAERLLHGAFVFTSNVDGQFQKAGFAEDRIVECHGSLHHLQCFHDCQGRVWSAREFLPEVDEPSCRLASPLPHCPRCGALARPNVLMFGDWNWQSSRTEAQRARLEEWLSWVERPVVVEIGAGTAIPTVRWFGEMRGVPLIRLNPGEWEVCTDRAVGLALGAHVGLQAIARELRATGFLG